MSPARRLIAEADRIGVSFLIIGSDRIKAVPQPGRILSPEFVERARAAKAEIIAELRQSEADRRNTSAITSGTTGRWCLCGELAPYAWPSVGGRQVWRCLRCMPVDGEG